MKYFEESKREMLSNDCTDIKTNLPETEHIEVPVILRLIFWNILYVYIYIYIFV